MKRLKDIQTIKSRAHISGTRVKTEAKLTFDDEEESTQGGNHTIVVYQQFLMIFDSLSSNDKEQLLVLANAFAELSEKDRAIIVNVAEKMSGLVKSR